MFQNISLVQFVSGVVIVGGFLGVIAQYVIRPLISVSKVLNQIPKILSDLVNAINRITGLESRVSELEVQQKRAKDELEESKIERKLLLRHIRASSTGNTDEVAKINKEIDDYLIEK